MVTTKFAFDYNNTGTTTAASYIVDGVYYSNPSAVDYYHNVVYPKSYGAEDYTKSKPRNKILSFEEKLQDEIDDWLNIFKEN